MGACTKMAPRLSNPAAKAKCTREQRKSISVWVRHYRRHHKRVRMAYNAGTRDSILVCLYSLAPGSSTDWFKIMPDGMVMRLDEKTGSWS